MFALKAPRLDRALVLHTTPLVFCGKATTCRLSATRQVASRPRHVKTVKAVGVDSATASVGLDFAVSSAPDSQKLVVAAIGTVGLIVLGAISFATQFGFNGRRVTSIPPAKLDALLRDKNTLLVDIRNKSEIKASGSPSMKGYSASSRSLPFTKRMRDGQTEVVKNFGEAFAKMKGVTEDSVVVLLDATGRQAQAAAAEILNFNDFNVVYCLSGGATALEASGFAWKKTPKGISLSLPKVDLKGFDLDKIAESYKQRPTLFNTGLALSALAAAGVVLFQEFDLILETVGVLGGANVLFKRFFFAEDRKKTIQELRSLVNEKIAANEAGDDLKRLASTILEVSEVRSPAVPPVTPSSTAADTTVAVGEAQV